MLILGTYVGQKGHNVVSVWPVVSGTDFGNLLRRSALFYKELFIHEWQQLITISNRKVHMDEPMLKFHLEILVWNEGVKVSIAVCILIVHVDVPL